MFRVSRLDAPFGVEVFDTDVRLDHGPALIRGLVDLLYQHRLVVIRGQNLTEANLVRFGSMWGRPQPHLLTHKRMPGHPVLMTVGNTFERAANDRPAVFWHTDLSYEAEPASATMLYCVMAPEVGGETIIADMAAAYDALESTMKARIEHLKAIHLYGAASGQDGENKASEMISDEQRRRAPPVPHPLVLAHPVTGRRALYAVAGTPISIEGMDEPEALAILRTLKKHAVQDRFTHAHKYRVGDIAIWDTLSTLHTATPIPPATGAKDSRLLWRISVKGLPGYLQGMPAQA